jgi:hypothetical protein
VAFVIVSIACLPGLSRPSRRPAPSHDVGVKFGEGTRPRGGGHFDEGDRPPQRGLVARGDGGDLQRNQREVQRERHLDVLEPDGEGPRIAVAVNGSATTAALHALPVGSTHTVLSEHTRGVWDVRCGGA